jgi:hypothetical protein
MTAAPPTLARLKPNPHWAKLPLFNRKNWSHVRFGGKRKGSPISVSGQ